MLTPAERRMLDPINWPWRPLLLVAREPVTGDGDVELGVIYEDDLWTVYLGGMFDNLDLFREVDNYPNRNKAIRVLRKRLKYERYDALEDALTAGWDLES